MPARASLDPYLTWAAAQNFRGHAVPRVEGPKTRAWRNLSCVFELDLVALRAASGLTADAAVSLHQLSASMPVTIAAAYGSLLQSESERVVLGGVIRTDRILEVEQHPAVRRLIMSVPRTGRARGDENLSLPSTGSPGKRPLAGADGRPVLAVIDTGLPFVGPDWERTGRGGARQPRVKFLWDQDVGTLDQGHGGRSPKADPWEEPSDFGYGRELSGVALARLISQRRPDGLPVDDASVYASLIYPAKPEQGREARRDQPIGAWALPESTHGAQCAGVAASPRTVGVVDAAADADLVFVQLPGEMVDDTSGGGLASYVLDALHYIVSRVHPRAPLVVNLSYGAAAGPHDGTTLLDQAIGQMLAGRPGMVVVVPAGNLNGDDGEPGADETRLHARAELPAGTSSVTLNWQVPAASDGDHYLELWPQPGAASHGATPNAHGLSSVDFELTPPNGLPSLLIKGPRDGVQTAVSPDRTFGLIYSPASPLAGCAISVGRSGREMVLAAIAGQAAPGLWKLELTHNADYPVMLDAWIERADPSLRRASLQSHFARGELHVSRQSTLSSLANGRSVVVVGGMAGEDRSAAPALLSSSGPALPPSGRLGPDLSAPCEESALTPWRTVPGFCAGSWVQGNGTSIAAPVAARWILNLLAPRKCLGRSLKGQALKDWVVAQVKGPAGMPAPDTRRGLIIA